MLNVTAILDPNKVRKVSFAPDCGCNTSDETILEQVRFNIRRGLTQAQPHAPHPSTVILVCGGPSLAETEKELVEAYWNGGKIVAANGAYQWCLDRNIKPSAAVMLDAREFNSRFVEMPVDGCRYLLASQCHPRTFEICRGREVVIWHACSAGDDEVELIREYYFQRTFPVTLGTTIGIRSISLLRMLGFQTIDIFGLDSCWLDNKHHSYEQKENDKDKRMPLWLRPANRDDKAKRFICSPWHVKQAEDFMGLIRDRGELFQLSVRGPGLIATMMRTGAEIQMESDHVN